MLIDYRVDDDTDLTPDLWNGVFGDVTFRLRALEAQRDAVEEAIIALQAVGLERIDQAVGPAIAEAQSELATLSASIDALWASMQPQFDTLSAEVQTQVDTLSTTLTDSINASAVALQGQLTTLETDVQTLSADVQAQIDAINAGGISADLVTESAARKFATPAQLAAIDAITADWAASPELLNSFNEIAAAIADDQNFSATVFAQIALKADSTWVTSQLAVKADSTWVTTQLAGKSNNGHGHAISEITSLQTTLNAKQNALSMPATAEIEAGTATTARSWSAAKIKEAIEAHASGGWTLFAEGDLAPFGSLWQVTGLDPSFNQYKIILHDGAGTLGGDPAWLQLRLGDAGGLENFGYPGGSSSGWRFSAGWQMNSANAEFNLHRITDTRWIFGPGSEKALSGPLDRVGIDLGAGVWTAGHYLVLGMA